MSCAAGIAGSGATVGATDAATVVATDGAVVGVGATVGATVGAVVAAVLEHALATRAAIAKTLAIRIRELVTGFLLTSWNSPGGASSTLDALRVVSVSGA